MPLLTTKFSINELSATAQPYYNVPGPIEELYLLRLCELILEPLSVLWGVPISVSSGYRSQAVNHAVGGAPESAHRYGRAADITPLGLDIDRAFGMLVGSPIPFDQSILEKVKGKQWIHVQIAKIYERPRRQALTKGDNTPYLAYSLPTIGEGTA